MIKGSNTASWIIKPRQNSATTVYLKNEKEEEERYTAMEASSRSADAAATIKQESERDKSSDGDEDFKREGFIKVPIVTEGERSTMEVDVVTSSSSRNDQDEELESARAEMGEVREENQRLKMCLDLIMKDYRTLQMQFDDIVQRDGKKKKQRAETGREVEETELVSLTLGRFPSEEKKNKESTISSHQLIKENDQQIAEQDLTLGLDCQANGSRSTDQTKVLSPKDRSPSLNSIEEIKEGEGEEPWLPSKGLKTMRSVEDDVVQQNPPKKARVCVRARCDTPTMNDGCQWRKYGQKIAKGNPCPRAYYRCTGAPSCPVRKQVQRCAEEMSILITTYEGTHNHPLSVSATAMASTTSAAAAMLLSGSSSSRSSLNTATATATTAPANLHGLNFYLSDGSNSKQFFLPNSSISSSSPTHPTITLDLTVNPSSSSSSSHFNRLYPPRYPFTSLDFVSSQSNVMSWSNGLLGYGNQPPYNRSQMGPLEIGGIALQNNIYKNFMQKPNNSPVAVPVPVVPPRHPLPDTIAAATKAITSYPSFQSVLAAALTSFVGNGGGSSGGGGDSENFSEKLKWMENFPLLASNQKGNGCGSSFINTAPTTNTQPSNLIFLSPNSSPFSSSKSASTSPGDNRDHQPSL